MIIPSSWYLLLSAVLFTMGVAGFLIKRTFAHDWHAVKGQIFVFFVMMVAAAEAAVGLAIIIAIFRIRGTLNVDQIDLMKL